MVCTSTAPSSSGGRKSVPRREGEDQRWSGRQGGGELHQTRVAQGGVEQRTVGALESRDQAGLGQRRARRQEALRRAPAPG